MSKASQEARTTTISRARSGLFYGLSAKLLLLTISFVMISEILIYVPSVAKFRRDFLFDKLRISAVAADVLMHPGDGELANAAIMRVLARARVQTLATRMGKHKQLLAMIDMPPPVSNFEDLRDVTPLQSIVAAFDTLINGNGRTMRIVGKPPEAKVVLEIVFDETRLRNRMLDFSVNILLLSLVISIFTATAVYFSLRALLVRPIVRMSNNMAHFAEDPDDSTRIIKPSGRRDEVGLAEIRLAEMEGQIGDLFHQQKRLADLGLAVSKINHDLRNILASAQLFSDRLSMLKDPTVQRVVPKLIGALDRATAYSQAVMSYGKAQEAEPVRRLVALRALVEEVAEFLNLPEHDRITWENKIPDDVELYADPEQLFRILMNVCRNASQVLENSKDATLVCKLAASIDRSDGWCRLVIEDTGPGVPVMVRDKLFMAFQASSSQGGTGLGLAISAELVKAHGGTIKLLDKQPGAHFEICLPDHQQNPELMSDA
ncbi:MAG: HAMP domain-containing histidine kinase [Cohaesibacteraceae bacterium]|nr:HAMP domain-containing histidine kinase [Cohaesibacteraceae bacterium]